MKRNWTRYLLLPVLLVQALSSCSHSDEPDAGADGSIVSVSLAFSASTSVASVTRMSDDIVQVEGKAFRGMQDVKIVPFVVDDSNLDQAVGLKDLPAEQIINELGTLAQEWFYYYKTCSFMRGVNAVLCYGRAIPEDDKATNGSIVADYPVDMVPENIHFSLEPIYTKSGADAKADALAAYMTSIARATGWSTANDSQLKAYYLNFIAIGNDGTTALLAGSSASVKAYVADLRSKIDELADSDIKTAIIDAIDDYSTGLDGYPANIDLPDGAAVLKWDSNKVTNGEKGAFVPQTLTTMESAINSLSRFAHPAELYYFANSRLYTSSREVAQDVYENTDTWNNVLGEYDRGIASVSGNTKSVAVKEPMQYGVARLKMTMAEIPSSLKDGRGTALTGLDASKFPLTAVIVGGQHTVGYDFKPQGERSDDDMRFAYDKNVGTGNTVNTLVLQSYDGEVVTIILEFENKSGVPFVGKDGIIYPDTKFYLVGKVNPNDASGDEEVNGRVFTQDHITSVTMVMDRDKSLPNAYNVMPDLLTPRLEIGIQLVAQWIGSTITNVPLQ